MGRGRAWRVLQRLCRRCRGLPRQANCQLDFPRTESASIGTTIGCRDHCLSLMECVAWFSGEFHKEHTFPCVLFLTRPVTAFFIPHSNTTPGCHSTTKFGSRKRRKGLRRSLRKPFGKLKSMANRWIPAPRTCDAGHCVADACYWTVFGYRRTYDVFTGCDQDAC